MKLFRQLFSEDNEDYAVYRPTYPKKLFDRILSRCSKERELAVDVATGTGQAASILARSFERVVGTDVSPEQLSQATQAPNIRYATSTAEAFVDELNFEEETVDLVTAAAAVHWFDTAAFYEQCRRVLKPDGVLAVWAYGLNGCANNALLKPALKELYDCLLGQSPPFPYQLVRDKYKSMLPTDDVFQQTEWFSIEINRKQTLKGVMGYLKTLSFYKTYKEKHANEKDPLDIFYSKAVKALNLKHPDQPFMVTIEMFGFLAKRPIKAREESF